MNAIGKLGVFLTFVGFLGLGSASLYAASASPTSVQDASQVARNAGMAQGVAWIVAGTGLAMAFSGLSMELHDLKTVVPDISALNTSPLPPTARKVPRAESQFVCSDCGGDIAEDDKKCPHCGARIEGE